MNNECRGWVSVEDYLPLEDREVITWDGEEHSLGYVTGGVWISLCEEDIWLPITHWHDFERFTE